MCHLWRTGGETFPGEASWRRQADTRLEGAFAPVRAGIVLVTCLLWFWLIRPRMGASPATWALVGASIAWVVSEAVLARRGRRLSQRAPYLSVFLGALMVISWVAATGGGRSPFLPLLFVGLATAPSRLGLSLLRGLGATWRTLPPMWASPASPTASGRATPCCCSASCWCCATACCTRTAAWGCAMR